MIKSTAIMIIIITTTTITTPTAITLKNKNSNNNKNIKNNDSTNDKAVYNAKLQTRLLEIQNEKHTQFLNLKTYEEQTDQIDLSQRNKRMCILHPNN